MGLYCVLGTIAHLKLSQGHTAMSIKMLNYKDFIAQITQSDTCYCATEIKYKDNTLKDVISVHADTLEQLQEEFKISIDDYLDWVSTEPWDNLANPEIITWGNPVLMRAKKPA